jgi:tetratricopeptide (TPR) repeat protein
MSFGLVLFSKFHSSKWVSAARPGFLLALVFLASGCSELQARRHARAGNDNYLDGNYEAAVREYEIAEQAYPGLHVVALNKGLACRQLMIPGANTPEQERAADCALASFTKMKELRPDDPRGEQLYVQTLFDADRFDMLTAMYEAQLKADPNNLGAINSLINVHSRADNWAEALRWSIKRADIEGRRGSIHGRGDALQPAVPKRGR